MGKNARCFGQDLMRGEHIVGGGKPRAVDGMVRVTISTATMRQLFHPCTPEFIAGVCKASCCESSTSPSGTMISIHASEAEKIAARGGVISGGLLQPSHATRKCPFKSAANLCGLHGTPDKPFGCIASPFTLSSGNALIVRNRYRLLKCFKAAGAVPVYKAHPASLRAIFGAGQAERIIAHFEAGGGDTAATISEAVYRMLKDNDAAKRAKTAKSINTQNWVKDKIADGEIAGGMASGQSGTSIFDPVLCELAYLWFCPPGGLVLDPFAGGSVRGIVAAKLGRQYLGVDLRPEQIAANREQAGRICKGGIAPAWHQGDSAEILPGLDCAADFVFSCPPYGDLEIYSDLPGDLSGMESADFLKAYRTIIAAAVAKLKPDRFACFVVGDFRDAKGFYRNFPGETIAAFEAAGARLYNEAILVTAVGSLPIRAGKQFVSSRKLGKTHQNVLVFCKGDPRKAVAACGEVDVVDFEEEAAAEGAAA